MRNLLTSALLLLCLGSAGYGAARAAASDYSCKDKIARMAIADDANGHSAIFLRCNSAWPDPVAYAPVIEVWRFTDDAKVNPTLAPTRVSDGSAVRTGLIGRDLTLTLTNHLEAGKKYILILRSAATPGLIDMYVEFTADAKGVIASSPAGAELGHNFFVTSALNATVTTLAPDGVGRKVGAVYAVTAAVALDETARPNQVVNEKRETASQPHPVEADVTIQPQKDANGEPLWEEVGEVHAELKGGKRLRQSKATVGVGPMQNVLGQTVNAENPVDLQPAPVGKDDASQYYQINHRVTKRNRPSFAINAKATSLPGMPRDYFLGNFLIQPNIVADIGTNDFAKKSDDTIQVGVNAFITKLGKPESFFQGIRFGPGIAYESNLHFRKNNLLGIFESRPLLKGLYESRETRRLRAAAEANPKLTSAGLIDSDKFPWGRGVEMFLGLEAGGSLRAQEFQNKAKTTTLDVPTYAIFRFRPRLHMFLEYRRLTFDVSQTFRLLATPEYVGEELPDSTIRLRRVFGFQPYSEVTALYAFDQSKHLNLSITYKRGAQPPVFNHANNVTTGFTIKY